MPDRTKLPRPTGDKAMAQHLDGNVDAVPIRSAFNQNTEINRDFGQPLLDTYAVQSVENQAAGPSSRFVEYEPDPGRTVKREGLESHGNASSPKAKSPRVP